MHLLALVTLFIVTTFLDNVIGNGQSEECRENVTKYLSPHLSDKVIPKRYSLTLTVDLDRCEFSGTISIKIEIESFNTSRSDKFLYLHAFSKLAIIREKTNIGKEEKNFSRKISIKEQCRYTKSEYWVLDLGRSPSEGQYILTLEFKGNLETRVGANFDGLYKESYIDLANNKVDFVANQFHRKNARRVFPCFDEPRFKSKFRIEFKYQSQYRVLCSMEATDTKVEGDWKVTNCKIPEIRTPPWLIGFNINRFAEKCETRNESRHCIYSRDDLSDATNFALEASFKVLQFHENYFNMSCPVKNLSFIAQPGYSFVGLEQWAIVYSSEEFLLWREGESTSLLKLAPVRFLCHELSHEWFANRVSIRYWRDEWLNEGLATWVQYKCGDVIEDGLEYQYDRIDLYDDGFGVDAKEDSQPVVQNISRYELHDPEYAILYRKAAAIVTMMEGHLGKKKFKKRLRRYLKKFNEKTAVTDDFLDAMKKVEKGSVKEIYSDWFRKAGFPYIKVTREKDHVKLVQERFSLSKKTKDDSVWHIPIRYYKNGKRRQILFDSNETRIEKISSDTLLKFNIDHQGFYITWYEDWNQLSPLIGSTYLTPLDYAGIILDIDYLTASEKVRYREVIPLLGQILNASDVAVTWRMGKKIIEDVYSFMKTTPVTRERLGNLVKTWLQGKYSSKMWTDKKSVKDVRFAVLIVDLACRFEFEPCLKDSRKIFDDWRKNQSIELPPSFRELIYGYGLKKSDQKESFDFLWQKYESAKDNPIVALKMEFIRALSFVKSKELVNLFLDYAWKEVKNSSGNFYQHIINIAENPFAVNVAWQWFQDNFEELQKSISEANLGKLLVTFASQFCDNSNKEAIEKLISKLKAPEEIRQRVEEAIFFNNKNLIKVRNDFLEPNK